MGIQQSIEKFTLRNVIRLPKKAKDLLLGKEGVNIAGRKLDRQLEMLAYLSNKRPGIEALEPDEARTVFANSSSYLDHPAIDSLKIRDRVITYDHRAIPVRTYAPEKPSLSRALVIYFHGGGWVVGDRDTHDRFCQLMCDQLGEMVLSVDYQLAPEHTFPAAVDDAFGAYQWALEHHEDLEIDPSKVIVAGDSAGGNLAAVVSLMARDKQITPPWQQVLIYPVTDLRQNTESVERFGSGFVLTAALMNWFIDHYCPQQEDRLNPLASPLLAESLDNLPPAIISLAGFDPLHDEGEAYADKLKAAGVPVTLLKHNSMLHGYINLTGYVEGARAAVDEIFANIKRGLEA